MKNPCFKIFFLSTFFILICISSAIASEKKSVSGKDTLNETLESPYCLSGGIYFGQHFAYQASVESDFNRRFTVGARVSKINLIDFEGIPCNNSQFATYCPGGNIKEFTVYGGKTFYFKKYFSFTAVTGPSIVDYYRPTSYTSVTHTYPYPYVEYYYKYSKNTVLGWTGKIELKAAPLKFAGIGLGLFFNYNKQNSFLGAMLSIQIGKLR